MFAFLPTPFNLIPFPYAMHWTAYILVYIFSWWMLLFTLLPIGVRPPEQSEPGHSSGAPERPYLKQKCIGATVLAFFLTWGVMAAIQARVIPLDVPLHPDTGTEPSPASAS